MNIPIQGLLFKYSKNYFSEQDFKFFHQIYMLVIECLQNEVYYDNLKQIKLEGPISAWRITTLNSYLQVIVTKWNNLFNIHGNDKQTNFKKLTQYGAKLKRIGIKTPDEKGILNHILQAANIKENEFEAIKNNLINYRNKFVSHKDLIFLTSNDNKLFHPMIEDIKKLTWSLYQLLIQLLATFPIQSNQHENKPLFYIYYTSLEEFKSILEITIPQFYSK